MSFVLKKLLNQGAHFLQPGLLLFWTSCVLPRGFQIQSGSLACTLSCLHAVIVKVTSEATPAFFTNRGIHCLSMYTTCQPSLFESHTCRCQTCAHTLVEPNPWPGLGPQPTVCKHSALNHSAIATQPFRVSLNSK